MNTELPILKELNERKSVRIFSPKEIEPEKLEALWAAAQWAPSSSNKQDWRYYALMGDARKAFAEVLSPGNHWALAAPLLLAVAHDASIEGKTESRAYGMYDTALSVMSLVIEAEHQGLRAHQMAGFHDEAFRRVLGLPPNELPAIIVAVGYEGSLEELSPEIREKENRPRTRKAIGEIVKIIKEQR